MPEVTMRKLDNTTYHIETPFAIVNIRVGLQNREGYDVESIEILSDGDRYAGEKPIWIDGKKGNACLNLRLIKMKRKPYGCKNARK